MQDEYQALLDSGFPNTTDNQDIVDESSAQALREQIFGRNVDDIDLALEADTGDGDGDGEGDGSERKKRRKNAAGLMTDEEKKLKQREQNRRAAEKSRSKRKNEFNALEAEVDGLQDENTRLRARLSALQSSCNAGTNAAPSPPLATPSSSRLAAPQDGTSVDYAYLDKIQSEVKSIRQQLIDKEHQLAQSRGEETPDEVLVLRQVLLDQYTSLKTLQAEASSLESLVLLLDKEKEEITKQTKGVNLALQGKSSGAGPMTETTSKVPGVQIEDAEEEGEPIEEQGGGVQKALAEIRGWVDAAVRDYQTSAQTAAT